MCLLWRAYKSRAYIILHLNTTSLFLFSTDRSGMTHQVKGTTNTSPKARTANTASNWIVPFMCIRISGVSALIEMAAYVHARVTSSHLRVVFVGVCNATYLPSPSSCQSASHSTLMPRLVKNTNPRCLLGGFVRGDVCA